MTREYLPSSIRDRLRDLMKERKINQSELAKLSDCSESTLSRFLTGKIDKLSDDNIVAIARAFNVSTDFLLGLTDTPDRINFDLAELGLSVEAGRALYTSRTNAVVINALLENKNFPALAQMILQYMEGIAAAGYAAQNQMYLKLAALAAGTNSTAASAIKNLRMPVYQADLTHIQNAFMQIVRELREDNSEKIAATKALTNEVMEQMIANLPKDTDIRSITPEQIVDAVTATVAGAGSYTEEQLAGLKSEILPLFQRPVEYVGDAAVNQ